MKRIIPVLLSLICVSISAEAQILCIDCSGEAIPAKYSSQIEQTLIKEVEFYGPLGLSDTVFVNLHVFKDNDSANAFLRQYEPFAYGDYCSGMFIHEINTAVLTSTSNMDNAVRILFHEISHALYNKVMTASHAVSKAYSLNEGMAGLFEFMKVKKDGSIYQKPDDLYIKSVKSLVELDEFDLMDYLTMDHNGFSDKSRHDGQISYHVSYVIVAVLFQKLGTEQFRHLLEMINSGISYKETVESLYPGGTESLEKDIKEFVTGGKNTK